MRDSSHPALDPWSLPRAGRSEVALPPGIHLWDFRWPSRGEVTEEAWTGEVSVSSQEKRLGILVSSQWMSWLSQGFFQSPFSQPGVDQPGSSLLIFFYCHGIGLCRAMRHFQEIPPIPRRGHFHGKTDPAPLSPRSREEMPSSLRVPGNPKEPSWSRCLFHGSPQGYGPHSLAAAGSRCHFSIGIPQGCCPVPGDITQVPRELL